VGFTSRHSGRFFYVGFEVFTAVVMKSINFWDITPCSPLSVYSSTLKMEAICSSETSVDTQKLILFKIVFSSLKLPDRL
jgi:hypothetical protein